MYEYFHINVIYARYIYLLGLTYLYDHELFNAMDEGSILLDIIHLFLISF
jgi:hypothetical protein